ncbi:NAD-dependent epimerase/dehydratase family protein [Paraburkholderia sp. USG1]|uniref:NAD-dependent epimerase/dehydratase family protein n=1 Tax=Paraburkholderia sp. USG1 TaxID=2952268 RepID=UPI002861C015|nr:NAD-dependent epimerase/dehydratase family protein [Paraburkholderia sp. USG1]MDR8398314.1 NAD-dependent epimerase/dehydratase family protein [Paraburkholderia sp. USG1]
MAHRAAVSIGGVLSAHETPTSGYAIVENSQRIFVTGITGYIGGSVAVRLKERGYPVWGLARRDTDIEALKALDIQAVKGSLQDIDVLEEAFASSGAIIHTADSDDPQVVENCLSLLNGTGKTFIHTSGSGIVANWDRPETAHFVYTEDFPLETDAPLGQRVLINNRILRSALQGIRSIVIVPGMVYGTGLLLRRESMQVPLLVRTAKERGTAVYVGNGEQHWSNVHVEDLADLYVAALEKARPGSCFFAENGLASFREIAEAIQKKLHLGGKPVSLSPDEAAACWGDMMATVALGSDCRVNADKARLFLEWKPRHSSILPFI